MGAQVPSWINIIAYDENEYRTSSIRIVGGTELGVESCAVKIIEPQTTLALEEGMADCIRPTRSENSKENAAAGGESVSTLHGRTVMDRLLRGFLGSVVISFSEPWIVYRSNCWTPDPMNCMLRRNLKPLNIYLPFHGCWYLLVLRALDRGYRISFYYYFL